jgi:hypothetical protein
MGEVVGAFPSADLRYERTNWRYPARHLDGWFGTVQSSDLRDRDPADEAHRTPGPDSIVRLAKSTE